VIKKQENKFFSKIKKQRFSKKIFILESGYTCKRLSGPGRISLFRPSQDRLGQQFIGSISGKPKPNAGGGLPPLYSSTSLSAFVKNLLNESCVVNIMPGVWG